MEYILIADDNKDITDILEKYVKKEGYGALIATDGIQTEERRVGKESRSRWSPYH